jgi:hypothetical protein
MSDNPFAIPPVTLTPVQLESGLGNWLFEDGSTMCWGGQIVETVTIIRPHRTDTYTVTDGVYVLNDSDAGHASQ